MAEDGRKPSTMKVTMRDCCKDKREKRTFSKESRQCRIQPRMLVTNDEVKEKEVVEVALGLVSKMVNFKAEFQLTLLGVAVADFVEEVESKASIKNFFSAKKMATRENGNPTDSQPSAASAESKNIVGNSSSRPGSSQSNCLKRPFVEDCTKTSPVFKKSRKVEVKVQERLGEGENRPPAGCDPEVWAALPPDLQKELRASKTPSLNHSTQLQHHTSEDPPHFNKMEETTIIDDVDTAAALNCPPGLDPEVFKTLPEDIKEELEAEARAKSRRRLNIVEERVGDLFSAPSNMSLAHCISQDCVMGKGIAKQFSERFGRVNEIKEQCVKVGGVAILKDKERFIYNLVTKHKYYEKPTMTDLRNSLLEMRKHMKEKGVESVGMPRIGCGLDLLDWGQVKRLLEEVFQDSSINIVIFTGLSTASSKLKTAGSILKYFSKK